MLIHGVMCITVKLKQQQLYITFGHHCQPLSSLFCHNACFFMSMAFFLLLCATCQIYFLCAHGKFSFMVMANLSLCITAFLVYKPWHLIFNLCSTAILYFRCTTPILYFFSKFLKIVVVTKRSMVFFG